MQKAACSQETRRMLNYLEPSSKSIYLVRFLSSLPQTKHLLLIRGCFGLRRKLKEEGNRNVRKAFASSNA